MLPRLCPSRTSSPVGVGLALVLAAVLVLAGCTGSSDPGVAAGSPSVEPMPEPSASMSPSTPTTDPSPAPVSLADLDVGIAVDAVAQLAGKIGPRMATGPDFREARRWVARQLRRQGYDVRREDFSVPAGTSWGVPVAAGRSSNLVAAPPEFDRAEPHLLIGAHLDTVPQAPGAEDNASGVGVLLAVASVAAGRRTRLPTVFVVFGAEEPRGPGDDDHHYGSRHHVAQLSQPERRTLRGMLALDRVGVGEVLPVCSAGEADRLRRQLLRAARTADVTARACAHNRASDHWSFARAGLPAARLGSTPYAGYHSAGDVPPVVQRAQLRRAARTTLAWLSPR